MELLLISCYLNAIKFINYNNLCMHHLFTATRNFFVAITCFHSSLMSCLTIVSTSRYSMYLNDGKSLLMRQ